MDTLSAIYNYIVESNIINFLIMVWILAIICKKISIKTSLNNAVSAVEKTIKKSEEEMSNSELLIEKAKETLEKLPAQIKNIENFNKHKTEIYKKQLEETAQKSISNIVQNIDKVIAIEEKKISNEITNETIINSVEQARNNIIKQLESDPELHKKFIIESLNELEEIEI